MVKQYIALLGCLRTLNVLIKCVRLLYTLSEPTRPRLLNCEGKREESHNVFPTAPQAWAKCFAAAGSSLLTWKAAFDPYKANKELRVLLFLMTLRFAPQKS